MALTAGTRLGPYEIVAPSAPAAWARCIARAIRSSIATSRSRCCPERSPHDPDRLARFSAKRKSSPSLNHPNIAHDLRPRRSRAASRALVMELVEGEDLVAADRARPAPARRGAADRAADRGRARSGARAGHHPSRSQAREHQGAARRHGEGARLRPREGRWNRPASPHGTSRQSPTITDAGDDARPA